jgi:hypothetical protein
VSDCSFPLLPLDVHHRAYEFLLNIDNITFNDNQEKSKCYNFKKADIRSILEFLEKTDWHSLFSGEDIDSCVDNFYAVVTTCFDLYIPTFYSSQKIPKHPWQSKSLKNLKNRMTRALKWSTRNRDRTYYERFRAEYKALHRQEYENYLEDVESNIKSDPKKFFEFANYKKKTIGLPSSMKHNGQTGNSSSAICELFANFFESVYEEDVDQEIDNSCDSFGSFGFSNIQISLSEIETALTGLNANKGPGDDGIPPSFVKLCADGLKVPLLHTNHYLKAFSQQNGRIRF